MSNQYAESSLENIYDDLIDIYNVLKKEHIDAARELYKAIKVIELKIKSAP